MAKRERLAANDTFCSTRITSADLAVEPGMIFSISSTIEG